MHYTWPLTLGKTWCPSAPDALVNTSVYSADRRLEFGGKAIEGLSVASSKQRDTRPPELLFQMDLDPDGGWSNRLLEFQLVYDWI